MNTTLKITALAAALPLLGSIGCAAQPKQAVMPASAACHQIPDPVQAASAFYAPGAVYTSRAIERTYSRQNWSGQVVGAEVFVRATPTSSPEYLQRALTCHAFGSGPAASPNDPLRPEGGLAEVRVRAQGHLYSVALFGNDIRSSKDAVARAKAMVEGAGQVNVREVGAANAASTDL